MDSAISHSFFNKDMRTEDDNQKMDHYNYK